MRLMCSTSPELALATWQQVQVKAILQMLFPKLLLLLTF
jgi:hypothetical protein